jgi:hypothetical protein
MQSLNMIRIQICICLAAWVQIRIRVETNADPQHCILFIRAHLLALSTAL